MGCWRTRRAEHLLMKEKLMKEKGYGKAPEPASEAEKLLTPSPPPTCFPSIRPRSKKAASKKTTTMNDNGQEVAAPSLSNPRSSNQILADLRKDGIIPSSTDLYRANLRVTSKTGFARGGLRWEVEDAICRAPTPMPTRPPSRSAGLSTTANTDDAQDEIRRQLERKQARSTQVLHKMQQERAEKAQRRRARAEQSRERARKIRAENKKDGAPSKAPASNTTLPPLILPKINHDSRVVPGVMHARRERRNLIKNLEFL